MGNIKRRMILTISLLFAWSMALADRYTQNELAVTNTGDLLSLKVLVVYVIGAGLLAVLYGKWKNSKNTKQLALDGCFYLGVLGSIVSIPLLILIL